MVRLFVGNFHFEHTLAAGRPQAMTKSIRRIDDELAFSWAAVAEDGDKVLCPPGFEDSFLEMLRDSGFADVRPIATFDEIDEPVEFCPWGWTDELRDLAMKRGFHFEAPPHEIVRKLNSRRFSFKFETDWNVGLNGATMVASVEELESAVTSFTRECVWVMKSEFGMAGRERSLGRRNALHGYAENWANKRLSRDGVLFVEPWVKKLGEVGMQFDVPKTGPTRLLGITPLITTSGGQYQASRFDADAALETRWSASVETGLRLCEVMQTEGYFGPVGIDAVRYLDQNGEERQRPLQDVNARWTMGRLSLGLRRLLKPGETGEWRRLFWPAHDLAPPQTACAEFVDALPAGVRAIRTSPFVIDERPVQHGSVVLINPAGE